MLCDVDVGNTRLKWRLRGSDSVFADVDPLRLVGFCERHAVRRVCVADVTPPGKMTFAWERLRGMGVVIDSVQPRADYLGLRLAYHDVGSFGVDRWLAMLAARQILPGNLVVMSAGTAITVDYVSAQGQHLGGLIVAGLMTSANALLANTHRVGANQLNLPENWQPGLSTLNCVEGGYSALYRGFIASISHWARLNMGEFRIIMTGGDAAKLRPLFDPSPSVRLSETLVLDGLATVLP